MELKAYTKSIKDILTLNNRYIIPRFQREYSWEKPELKEFFYDTIEQISIDSKNKIETSDYFIGSLVLIGNEKDPDFLVVDGQQRLTTITILFSVLTQLYKKIKENDLADSCYMFIEGKNDDNKPYFKLDNESPKPFLQHRIQHKNIDSTYEEDSEEEKKLLFAFNFYSDLLEEKKLRSFFSEKLNYAHTISYIDLLKSIRDQIKQFSVIYITVDNAENANIIFETLNAKGKNLEAIDLIKNEVFKILSDQHPTDSTKTKWKDIRTRLGSRENTENITIFLRHYWLSKYSFVRKANIYNAFKQEIPPTKDSYTKFINELSSAVNTYVRIICPNENDFPRNEQKPVLDSLKALNTFNVTQTRSIILALLEKYENQHEILGLTKLIKFLHLLECFHFKFTAVTSSRSSGLESIYSKYAIKIRKATNKNEINSIFTELSKNLSNKVPTLDTFSNKFSSIIYTDKMTKDRLLVKYILKKIEIAKNKTYELTISDFSIEHINDQSNDLPNMGCIGNLLPLSQKINSSIINKDFQNKISSYKDSSFISVKEFISEYGTKVEFRKADIAVRTKQLAQYAYNSVWVL